MKKILIVFAFSLLFPVISFAEGEEMIDTIELPSTMEELLDKGEYVFERTTEELPNLLDEQADELKDVADREVMPIWERISEWFQSIKNWFTSKIKSDAEEEYTREKEELVNDLPNFFESIKQRLMEIIK